jgi:hypothetical protein
LIGAAVASTLPVVSRVVPASAASLASADALKVSSLGHDPNDSTRFLQAALDSDARTVVVDRVAGGWITGPLFVRRSDVTVLVEPGVTVKALAGGYPSTSDCLLTVADVADVTISGYGATLAMRKPEYTSGEWRMALSLKSVRNAVVEGLVLRDSGGDGVYLGRGESAPSSVNVTLRDLVCDNNRRNALSVISVAGLTVEGCAFTNTQGTAPQAGVDFEPNDADESLSGITMRDCVLGANAARGISAALGALDSSSPEVSILIDRCTVAGSTGDSRDLPAGFFVTSARNGISGVMELRDSLLDLGPASSAVGLFNTDARGLSVSIAGTTIWDRANASQAYAPVVFSSGLQQEYGGLTFDDAVLVVDQAPPFLRAVDEVAYDPDGTAALTNVHGTLTVADPYGVDVDYGPNPPKDVDLAVETEPAGTTAMVDVQAMSGTARGGSSAKFRFSRAGGNMQASLAIAYTVSGSARERYDFGGLGRVAVIPAGARDVVVEVRTFARRQDSDPRFREIVLGIAPGARYESRPHDAHVLITD